MDYCEQCGHPRGTGRYCPNCGHPVPDGGGAGARTAVLPPVPPADSAPPVHSAPPASHRHREPDAAGAPAWLPWLVGLATMLLIGVLGAVLLFSGGDDSPGLLKSGPTTEAASTPPSSASTPDSATTAAEPAARDRPAAGADLTDLTSVEAPAPAPASRDTGGRPVTYVATNMLDGNPATCWRMPGDGTGQSITFRFSEPVELAEVGLVNGYAKVVSDGGGVLDWYRGNRRVQQVEWTFDDGTLVRQRLGDTTEMQTVRVDRVRTGSVTLRLLAVSPPGTGRASRDYTAISDVRLLGSAS